jgi:MFS family permease
MTIGLAITSLLAWSDWTTLAGFAGWTIAGIGMGLSTSSLSVLTLDLSDANNSGRNTSAGQMASTMSIATALAVSGTLLALNSDNPGRWVFSAIIGTSALLALAGLLISTRVKSLLA